MPITRGITVTLLVMGLVALFPIGIAIAQDKRPPRPVDPRELQHRRLIEEGERASRAIPPSPRPAITPNNGIEQIPIDTVTGGRFFKVEGKELEGETLRLRSVSSSPSCPYNQGMKTASLLKAFPEVTWHVCVTDMGLKGLWVGPVHLKRTPSGPWMTVLYQAGLAEIFVPYHQTDFRPYDLQWNTQLAPVTAQDAGINGTLINLTNDFFYTVVAEVRERGVGWLCKQTTMVTRRAQEFVVWGVIDGGNYDNIVQYSFRDDGGMTFRMGNTGFNAARPPASNPTPTEAHTHNALWRVDMDLNGALHNSAYWLWHREPFPSSLQARDYKVPFILEGRRQWNALQFTSLLIEDAATNAFGNKLGYEFTPVQTATSRHYGPLELWTRNDVYVTRYHGNELGWTTAWTEPDNYLLTYLNAESVSNRDLVVWIKTSAHHHPADEDRSVADLSTGGTTGVTLTHWSGFDVEPHNLFNANPLGGTVRCGT